MPAKKKSPRVKNLKPRTVKASKASSVRGGADPGRATFNEFTITKSTDKASSNLF
jgi:type VI protein secretion system component Hcp